MTTLKKIHDGCYQKHKSAPSLEIVQYPQTQSFESCICQDTIMTELSGKNYALLGFVETLDFQQIVKHRFTKGTVPVPRPLRFAMVLYYFSGVIVRQGNAISAIAEALRAVALKER